MTDLTPNQFPSYSTPDIFQNLKPENVFFCFVFPVHRVTGRDDVKDHVTFSVVCGWLQNEYIRRRKFGFRYFWHLRSLFTSLVTSPWVFCCLLLRHEVHTPSSSLLRGCLCSRCAGEWRSSNLIFFFYLQRIFLKGELLEQQMSSDGFMRFTSKDGITLLRNYFLIEIIRHR